MANPYLFLLNPHAGAGTAREAWPQIERRLRDADVPFEVEAVATPREAATRAWMLSFRPWRAVVAVGGDATVNGVASGLLRAAQAGSGMVPLSIIPVGTLNDFAHALGLPLHKPIAATSRLLAGQPRQVDAGWIRSADLPDGEWFFVNALGIGLDAFLLDVGPSPLSRFRALRRFQPPTLALTMHGRTRRQPVTLLTIGNAAREAGGLRPTPDAVPDDGQFDICLVREVAHRGLPGLLFRLGRGRHGGHVAVTIERATSLRVHSEGPLPLHLDNHPPPTPLRRFDVELLPGRLAVIV